MEEGTISISLLASGTIGTFPGSVVGRMVFVFLPSMTVRAIGHHGTTTLPITGNLAVFDPQLAIFRVVAIHTRISSKILRVVSVHAGTSIMP